MSSGQIGTVRRDVDACEYDFVMAAFDERRTTAREALRRARYKISVKTKIVAAYERAGGS